MLRCNEVTTLCASGEIGGAPFRTRLAVRLHLMICKHCRRYVRELSRIGAAARALMRSESDPVGEEAIIQRVLSELNTPRD